MAEDYRPYKVRKPEDPGYEPGYADISTSDEDPREVEELLPPPEGTEYGTLDARLESVISESRREAEAKAKREEQTRILEGRNPEKLWAEDLPEKEARRVYEDRERKREQIASTRKSLEDLSELRETFVVAPEFQQLKEEPEKTGEIPEHKVEFSQDIEYYLQEEPPANFDEKIDEAFIETLVRQGVVDKRQVYDVSDQEREKTLWDVYRNIHLERAEDRASAQWHVDREEKDVREGTTQLATEVFAAQPLELLGAIGGKGVNYDLFHSDLEDAIVGHFEARYGSSDEVYQKAMERVNTEKLRILNSNRGLVFFRDSFGDDITEDATLAAKWGSLFTSMGRPVTHGTGSLLTSKQSLKSESFLDQFGRLSALSVAAAMMESGEGFLHPDTHRKLRQGAAIYHHREDIGGWILESTVGDREQWEAQLRETAAMMREKGVEDDDVIAWAEMASGAYDAAKNRAGTVALVGAVLHDPDIVSIGLGGAGTVAKLAPIIGKVPGRVRRLKKGAKAIEEGLARVDSDQISFLEFLDQIKKTDPVLAAMLKKQAQYDTRLPQDIGHQLKRELAAAKKSKKKAEKERIKLEAEGDEVGAARVRVEELENERRIIAVERDRALAEEIQHREKLEAVLRGEGYTWEGALDPSKISKLRATEKRTLEDRALALVSETEREVKKNLKEHLGFDLTPGQNIREAAIGNQGTMTTKGRRLVTAQKAEDTVTLKQHDTFQNISARSHPDVTMEAYAHGTRIENVQGWSGRVRHVKAQHPSYQIHVRIQDDAGTISDWIPIEMADKRALKVSRDKAKIINESATHVDDKITSTIAARAKAGDAEVDGWLFQLEQLQFLKKQFASGRGSKQINRTAQAYSKRVKARKAREAKLEAWDKTYLGPKRTPKGKDPKELRALKERVETHEGALGKLDDLESAVSKSLQKNTLAINSARRAAQSMRKLAEEIQHKYGGLKGALRASEEDLAYFGSRVDEAAVNDFVGKVTKAGVSLPGTGKAVVNVDKLKYSITRELTRAYQKGKHGVRAETAPVLLRGITDPERTALGKALDKFLESDAGAPLKKLYDIPDREGLVTLAKVEMEAEDLSKLQNSLENLVRSVEGRRLADSRTMFGRALSEAWRDLHRHDVGKFGLLTSSLTRAYRAFDKTSHRWGEVSEDFAHAAKATENGIALFNKELMDYTARLDSNVEEAITTFLDWDGVLKVSPTGRAFKEGPLKWNVSTGEGTPFQKFKAFTATDTRLNPAVVARKEAEATAQRKSLLEAAEHQISDVEFEEAISFSIRVGGRKQTHTFKSPREIASFFIKKYSDEALNQIGLGEPSIGIQALSRMWVPGVTLAAAGGEKFDKHLLGIAYSLVENGESYQEVAENLRIVTRAFFGNTDVPVKAHGIGAAAVGLGANLGQFNYLLQRSATATIDATQAANMNRVLFNATHEIAEGEIDDAYLGLVRMGFPPSQEAVVSARGVQAKMKELVALGSSRTDGKAVFVPRKLIKGLEEQAGRILKEPLSAHPVARAWGGAGTLFKPHMSLWKQSIVTGLILPNPRYWTNNVAGDMSQIWIESGLATAGSRSFVNFFNNMPFIGREFTDLSLEVAERVGGKSGTRAALPSGVEAMFNPWIGRVFKGEDGSFITKQGRAYTFEDLRTMAAQDGIMESQVHEELLEVFTRASARETTIWGKSVELGKWWQKELGDHAMLVQQRQRLGLYAHYLQQGMGRKEATKKVLTALYDWKHGLADWEVNNISRMMPFYRFWRLSIRQIADAMMEPLVKPAYDFIPRAMTGNSKLARIRQQAVILPNLPDFLYSDDRAYSERGELDTIGKYLHPRWMESRAKIGSWPIDPKRAAFYEQNYNLDYTHQTALLPTFTALDSLQMVYGMYAGIGGMLASRLGEDKDTGKPRLELRTAPGYEAQFWEPVLSSTYPVVESMGRAFLSSQGVEIEYSKLGTMRNISPSEYETMKMIGMGAAVSENKDTEKMQVNAAFHAAWRNLPMLAAQLPGYTRAFYSDNPEFGHNWTKWVALSLGNLTRFYDVRPYSAEREADWRMKGIRDEMRKANEEYGAEFELGGEGPGFDQPRHEWEWGLKE